MLRESLIGTVQHRTLELELDRADPTTRTIPASLSSETAVRRVWGNEVLDHSPEAVDLSRARGGVMPLLAGHDSSEIPPPGRVENVRLVGKRLRGDLRFRDSDRGRDLFEAARTGFLRDVSIGYRIDELTDVGADDDGIRTFRAVKWTPLEASVVVVGADGAVGIGRSYRGQEGTVMSGESTDKKNDAPVTVESAGTERARVSEILAIGKRFQKIDLAQEAIANGESLDSFRKRMLASFESGDAMRGTADSYPSASGLGLSRHERESFSLNRLITAQASGDWSNAGFEREVSAAAAKKFRAPNRGGSVVPLDLVTVPQKRNVTVGGTGGNLVMTEVVAAEFTDVLRAQSVVVNAGARILDGLVGDLAIPRRTTAESTFWVAEDSAVTASDAVFDQVTLSPATCGVLTTLSRRLILQSTPAAEAVTRESILLGLAVEIDNVAINGGGANEPDGLLAGATGITIVPIATDGGPLTWGVVTQLMETVEDADALRGAPAFVTNAKVVSAMSRIEKSPTTGAGNFILDDPMPGSLERGRVGSFPLWVSSNVPDDGTKGTGTDLSALIFGDFSALLIGRWGTLEVASDPFTHFDTGAVQVRGFADIDIAVRHTASFAAITDIDTT